MEETFIDLDQSPKRPPPPNALHFVLHNQRDSFWIPHSFFFFLAVSWGADEMFPRRMKSTDHSWLWVGCCQQINLKLRSYFAKADGTLVLEEPSTSVRWSVDGIVGTISQCLGFFICWNPHWATYRTNCHEDHVCGRASSGPLEYPPAQGLGPSDSSPMCHGCVASPLLASPFTQYPLKSGLFFFPRKRAVRKSKHILIWAFSKVWWGR